MVNEKDKGGKTAQQSPQARSTPAPENGARRPNQPIQNNRPAGQVDAAVEARQAQREAREAAADGKPVPPFPSRQQPGTILQTETNLPVEASLSDQDHEPLANTRSGTEGVGLDEPKDYTAMPQGGPFDPVKAAPTPSINLVELQSRGAVQVREVEPTPEEKAYREKYAVDQVKNEDVVVLKKSYINDVLREPGYFVANYTGGIGSNLIRASEYKGSVSDR